MKNIKYISTLLICSFLFSTIAFSQNSKSNDLAQIRKSHEGKNLSVRWEKLTTEQALALLQKDGSFSDQKPDKKHITGRIMQLAISYQKNSYPNKEQLRMAIYNALQYWLDHRPEYRFPSVPFETLRAMAAIELVIYEDMLTDLENSSAKKEQVNKLFKSILEFSRWCWYNGKSPAKFDKHSGHNRGGNVGYRLWAMTAIASCSKNQKEMDWVHQIVKEQFPRVLNTSTDLPTGFTPDGSWIQHNAGGAQNYWIGYGIHWVSNVLYYANATNNTAWQLTQQEWNTLADYFIDGMQWYYYNNHGALNIAGRHNALKQAPLDEGSIRKEILRILEIGNLNQAKATELKTVLTRFQSEQYIAIDSSKYFWNTDLLIHSKPNAYFAIKMLSNRSTGCETSESERAHGKNNFFSGDGSTIIYRTGSEYDKARIGWNWRAWPGITALQKTGKLPLSPWGNESKSLNQFAGGLSTGYQGVAAFQYNRKNSYANLKANKAYFTFSNKMLALGNSIRKNKADKFDVWTTINQTERKGLISYCINGKKGKIKSGEQGKLSFEKLIQPSWIHHDNTGYLIIPTSTNSKIKLFAENRTGNWADLDGRYANEKNPFESCEIFQVSLAHGSHPTAADYAYVIIPAIDLKTIQQICKKDVVKIIQNNSIAQAVSYTKNSYLLVFYQAGEIQLTTDDKIKVDKPCIIHATKINAMWEIEVSDPLQKQDKVTISISEKEKNKSCTINFPKGIECGKAIKSIINL